MPRKQKEVDPPLSLPLPHLRHNHIHTHLHVRVKLELISLVADCKVALGHPRLGSLKVHLVASQPALIPQHQSTPDGRPSNVEIHVAAQVDVLPLVSCLDFSIFLPERKEILIKIRGDA